LVDRRNDRAIINSHRVRVRTPIMMSYLTISALLPVELGLVDMIYFNRYLLKKYNFYILKGNALRHVLSSKDTMTMVMEKRKAEIVRYGRRKERTLINKCQLKD